MGFSSNRDQNLLARARALFPEREIFLRSGGKVRFFRISAGFQAIVIIGIAVLLAGWAAVTLAMLLSRADLEANQLSLARQQADVAGRSAQVARYQKSADTVARELEQRLDYMEDAARERLGSVPAVEASAAKAASPSKKISALPLNLQRLGRIEERQKQLAASLTRSFNTRGEKAARALASLGIDPKSALRRVNAAQGGPFEPWRGQDQTPPHELRDLAQAIARLDALEGSLAAIPSGRPTAAPMVTSSYGFRRDPFNGQAAFHAGIDFVGRYGQPILAAAHGTVSFVGQRSGYGNVVEVDHGNGMMTRYAHLSGFDARVGQRVARGQQLARMGSTGRSTGTHLHFEVRIHGEAVNPRRFLEANSDVLQIQQVASQRFNLLRNRG